ncbi:MULTISPECIES: EpaQ family protein [unclassified Enterococcus]|uniref:EpaQ family protein n=1 Tax=unclassified Enterococcus TaxID=2608891 RepID=UPI001CE18665|nr:MULTISPECIES: EpaQ family protein [unclassified Enterococcus]MCA5013086.1 EpaQ family protein [Enterococcus sp. S23]MCA5016336.1 EpaQ family protein [Enterococcus sp. S22(2020)]
MDKILNRISNLILLVTIAGSYLMWVVGISTPTTGWIYANSVYLLSAAIALVLLLRIKSLTKADWILIILAAVIFVFYTLTSSMRHSNRFINASIPLIILLLLCFKKTKFTKIDLGLLAGISGTALFVTIYRMYVELPKLIDPALIWKNDNKLEAIWINTNTIGMTIFLSVMMLTIIIKSFNIGYFKLLVIPVYAAGLLGVWVCQSKASLGALIFFILVDNIVPKKLLKNNYLLLAGFALFFVAGPFIFYQFAESDAMNLFTGRENIWAEFFEKWFSNTQNMFIGMEPFTASWKSLGTHNSFIYTLSNYGIIGYTLIFSVLLYLLATNVFAKTKLSALQVSLFLAFLAICIQATMEDTLLANYWMPIVYSFVGLALQKSEEKTVK